MEIIPAILTNDPAEFDKRLLLIKNTGATRVHIDILDNTLVVGHTISGCEQLQGRDIGLKIDVHFMTSHPIGDASKWTGVQNISRMIAHVESDDSFSEFAKEMYARKIEPWIGINPETDSSRLDTQLSIAHGVLWMTVQPGRQGRSLSEGSLKQMSEFHIVHPTVELMVDGGVSSETMDACLNAGATHLVSGSAYLELLK